jgi:tRNA nucleotidyltransferase (CCA-adding enzyme)
VYDLAPGLLVDILGRDFKLDQVGASFGVVKLHGLPIDISVPRRESKSGFGHKGFDVTADPKMTPEEAASRRDFTINALMVDSATGEVVDAFGGLRDLEDRRLRHTSEKFAEDPLRVLRAMQFAARFEFAVDPDTVRLCAGIQPEGLARERILDEWRKLILSGARPSRGLAFLRDCGWVRYYPELEALIGCQQDPVWHPEGDVWTHTLHCMDAFARQRTGDPWEDLVVGFAVLCHDMGKPATFAVVDGRIRAFGHEAAGEGPTRAFLARLTSQEDLVEAVVPLVLEHMRPVDLFDSNASDNAVRRLASRVKRIDRLVRVARADQGGRPPLPGEPFPAGDWLLERARAENIADTSPKPILMGRHLIEMGLEPSALFSDLLGACYEAQLDGRVASVEEGKAFARRWLASSRETSGSGPPAPPSE